MSRPFRFGVVNSATGALADWVAAARRAESLGYATFLLPDTLGSPAPLPALAAAAAATDTLHVGTWVSADPLRHPRLLAWEAATVHRLAGGRFELGLGAGRPGGEADCAAVGMPFGAPGERVARLADTVGLLREAVAGLPLVVAAAGPRLLALAAGVADTVALGWPPTTTLDEARRRVAQVRAAAAARPEPPELAAGVIAVGDGEQPWLARMGLTSRQLAARGAVTVLTGEPARMVDTLEHWREALGISYVTVPANAAEPFAPVVAQLAGR